MSILYLFISICIPLFIGLILLSVILRDRPCPLLERLGLGFGIGIGIVTLIMFVLNLMNIKLGYLLINFILSIIFIPILIWALYKRYPVLTPLNKIEIYDQKKSKYLQILEYSLFTLITLKLLYVFFEALVKPVMNWDALWRHSLIAKAIFWDRTFQMPFTLSLLTDNPPFTSFAQSWIFFGINSWNEMLGKIIFPLLFMSMLIIFYCNLRKYFTRLNSLLFTFLLSSLPLLTFHASTAYPDFPQTYFYTIGTLYLFIFIMDDFKNMQSLVISAIFLGIGIFVKRHGIYLAGINSVVLAAALYFKNNLDLKNKINYLLVFIILLFVVAAPWLYFNRHSLSGIAGNIATPFSQAEIVAREGLPPLAQRIPVALAIFRDKMFFFGNWHLAWAVLLLSLIFFGRIIFTTPLIYLFAIICLNLLYTFIALVFTVAFRFLLDGTLLNRLMMYHMPLVVLLNAFSFLYERKTTPQNLKRTGKKPKNKKGY